MSDTTTDPASPRAQLGLLLRGLDHRGQLAALEAGEAGDHIAGTLLTAAAGFALALLTGITLTFSLAAAVWHLPERGWILGGAALLQLTAAILLGLYARARWQSWQPLAATREQLREDCRLIGELVPGDTDRQ